MAGDIATLGLQVNAQGVQEANKQLDALVSKAGEAERGADKLAEKSAKLGNSLASMAGPLGRVVTMLAGAFSIGAITRLSDEWSDLTSRVNLASGSIDKGTEVMGRLQKMANATYSSLRTTTEGYIANATILRGMGKSTKDTLDYTEALNNAMVVSGAKAERAASVQNALSKAMALGKLSGENLNTVIANGGRVAELLAEKLNTTVPGLIAMGQQGVITGDIITTSLIGNMQLLAEEAESMPATVGDAFQRMQNNLLSTVGSFDQLFGSSESLAGALLVVADHIDRIVVTAGTAAVAFGTYYVGGLVAAAVATGGLSGALMALRYALISTGIGAVIVLIGEMVYQLLEARKATGSWGAAFAEIAKRIELAMQGLKWTYYALIDSMKGAWSQFMSFMIRSTEQTMQAVYKAFGATFGGFGKLADESMLDAKDHLANASDQFAIAGDYFKDALAAFDKGTAVDLSTDTGVAGIGGGGALAGAGGKKGRGGGGGKGAREAAVDELKKEMESRLEVLTESLRAEEDLKAEQYLKDLETLEWARENEKISQDQYNQYKLDVERKFQDELFQLRGKQFAGALDATADFFGSMASLQEGGNASMLKAQKIFAAASALVNAYLAASQVLADPTIPFWGKFAAVAAVVAKGVSLVAAIKSGSKNAGGGGGGAAAKPSAAAPEQKPINQQAVEINLHGEVYSKQSVADLMSKMNELGNDGFKLNIRTT